jgi:GAF domain-containing protein
VVIEGEPKVYPDARIYAQVRDNPAIPDLGVVAYAGMPLTDADGRTLGSLCAIDTRPRAWTKAELAILEDLAAACSSELRLRIAREVAEEARRHTENAHEQLAMLAELTETLAATWTSTRPSGTWARR